MAANPWLELCRREIDWINNMEDTGLRFGQKFRAHNKTLKILLFWRLKAQKRYKDSFEMICTHM